MVRLEHANISVTDAPAVTEFLLTAFPEFRIRGGGRDTSGDTWSHVGNDDFYIAISAVSEKSKRHLYGSEAGLNHLGWEIDDIDALKKRMVDAGYTLNMEVNDHPGRRRIYFFDPTGADWEFVQYLTAESSERNLYDS